ncbi:MAG: hypothetical protein Q8P32_04080 [Candidatus Komeilibacteria bacterium]|nr:hypothetical protein [Candidatus Komeilibacteria bacterium]
MAQQLITKLTAADRMIGLQFDFTNEQAVPWNLRNMPPEKVEDSRARRQQNKPSVAAGIDLLPSKPRGVKPSQLTAGLIKAGYVLVNAKYQERIDQCRSKATYHMVRFLLVRQEYEQQDEPRVAELKPLRGILLAELAGLCQTAYWQIRAFRNPYYDNHVLVAGQYYPSFNFDGRQPLLEHNNLPGLDNLPAASHELELRDAELLLIS